MTVTKEELRKALGRFATGVTVITVTKDNGAVHGVTANPFIGEVVQAMVHQGQPLLFSAGKYRTPGDEVSQKRKAARESFQNPAS